MAASAVLMGIFTFKGIKTIAILGYIAIPAIIFLSMGLIVPCLFLMTTNIFTTNASNLYSTSLNLYNALEFCVQSRFSGQKRSPHKERSA